MTSFTKKKQCHTPHQCVLCLTPARCTREPLSIPDEKYCHNRKWRRKLKEISFRTRGFGDNLDDFWPRYCRAKDLDLSRVLEPYL